MLDCFGLLSAADMSVLCVVLWRLWNHRNLIVHGLPVWSLEEIFDWASCFIEEYQNSAVSPVNSCSRISGLNSLRWVPPLRDKFLLNSDAAVDGSRRMVGFGLVIRNFEGCVMASSSQSICASYSPMVAEAVAILKGLQLAVDTGLVPVDLVSDAAVVVGLVNDMKEHGSEIGLVIDAIRKLMLALPSSVLRFAPRATNFVAHKLAKFALVSDVDCVWLEDFPRCVRDSLLKDAPGCL
ncbi:hypothetical protein Q3G72_013826 [Acer saccharum]|nr:hypothetical protein Q3G72_013826 [Acer saccharum]